MRRRAAGCKRTGTLGLVAGVVVALVAGAAPAAPAVAAQDGQWWHIQWRMDEVWSITDGSGVTVAVIDSGVDPGVPELADAVLPGNDYFPEGGDGRVDRDDDGGHGTGMASLIAADGSGSGITGVAPGVDVLPVALPLGDSAPAGPDPMPDAIRWAADNGADIINLSIGLLTVCSRRSVDAVRYAVERDVVVVSSAGNTPDGVPESPGNCPGVLTVGATDAQLQPWSDTTGSEFVDVAAPGVEISAVGSGGQVVTTNGTSMSTALVSGVAALLRAQFPGDSAEELVARIIATARDTAATGWDELTGYGVVRPYQALTEPTVPPDTPNPPFEALADAPPPLPELPTGAPSAPTPAPAPPLEADGSDDSGAAPSFLLLLGVGLGLLVASVVAIVLLLLLRRRPAAGSSDGPGPASPGPGD